MTNLPSLSAKVDHQAGRLDSWVSSRQSAWKFGNTDRTTTTLSDDPDLQVQLNANTVYRVTSLWVYVCAADNVDLNIGFDVPSGSDGRWGGPYNRAEDSIVHFDGKTWGQTYHIHCGAANEGVAFVTGTLWTTSAGTLAVFWGQLGASATPTTIKLGSYLDVTRIGDN
jgi:hypothetical protein